MASVKIDPKEYHRYKRQIRLPEFGQEGQDKLKSSSILVIGAGGLGSPLLLYLTAAGIGHLGIVEFDVVDESNLHRQILYGTSELGTLKIDAAFKRLHDLNPLIKVTKHPMPFELVNAMQLVSSYDLVIDGSDNFSTRYLVNDACVFAKKPLVSASILGFEGQLSVFNYADGPCYRCLFPFPPKAGTVPSCAEAGVIGALCGVFGSMQAMEGIKVILQKGDILSGKLWHANLWDNEFQILKFDKNPHCPICGKNSSIKSLQVEATEICLVVPKILSTDLRNASNNASKCVTLIDVREDSEFQNGFIENAGRPPLHIPLGQLPSRLGELDPQKEYVVYCHSGARSKRAVTILLENHFQAKHLEGGIEEWNQTQR